MADVNRIADWIGHRQICKDFVSQASVEGMRVTLGNRLQSSELGCRLPPLWHWMFFSQKEFLEDLGVDGHPRKGGFLPPIALPRRMTAGARYKFYQPLRIGERIERESVIESIEEKVGRTGTLIFVTVMHTISGEEGVALEEWHDIVYRAEARVGEARAPRQIEARSGALWEKECSMDSVSLFRYSALTFVGHKIHYDWRYATQVEGYPGILVHGPLTATLLVEFLRDVFPALEIVEFKYRAVAPLYEGEAFSLRIGRESEDGSFWLQAVNGGFVAMDAHAVTVGLSGERHAE